MLKDKLIKVKAQRLATLCSTIPAVASGHSDGLAPICTSAPALASGDPLQGRSTCLSAQLPQSEQLPRFMELFAGAGGLTKAVQARGLEVHEPGDIVVSNVRDGRSTDVSDDNVFKTLRDKVRRGEVRWLHLAPPCRTFVLARRADRFGSVVQLRSHEFPEGLHPHPTQVQVANLLMTRAAKLAKTCLRAGAWFSIENQRGAIPGVSNPLRVLQGFPVS